MLVNNRHNSFAIPFNTNNGLNLNELEFIEKVIDAYNDSDNSDIIDADGVLKKMRSREKGKYVEQYHEFKIWQCATDGTWRTYAKDNDRLHGRRLIVKPSREKLVEFLYDYYQEYADGEEKRNITLRSLYPKWKEYKALTAASTYMTRIECDWKSCYLDSEIIDIPIQKLDKLTLETWALNLIKNHDIVDGKS